MMEMEGMDLARRVDHFKEDYNRLTSESAERFFCPILGKFVELGDLQRGHIVPDAVGGRAWVPQSKKVDQFFGGSVQELSVLFQRSKSLNELQILADKRLAQETKPKVLLSGKEVAYFPIGGRKKLPSGTPQLFVQDDSTKSLFGLRLSNEQCEELAKNGSPQINVEVHHDFSAACAATFIHTAYLTLFAMLGYRFAMSFGGERIGVDILGAFFRKSGGKHSHGKACHQTFFRQYTPLVRQLHPEIEELKGTIHDQRMLLVIDTLGAPWAFLVIVPMGEELHGVLIPISESPDQAAKFEAYLNDPFEYLSYRLCRFDREIQTWHVDSTVGRTHWTEKAM